VSGWQPIDTVRTDGVPVWLYDPHIETPGGSKCVVGWWSEVRGEWKIAGYDEVGFDPTHWREIVEPEPPP
jgi:hypothetical protein